jgi:predicted type IV restriction endonuclease
MEINKDTRDQFITKLKKLFSENIAKQIETKNNNNYSIGGL